MGRCLALLMVFMAGAAAAAEPLRLCYEDWVPYAVAPSPTAVEGGFGVAIEITDEVLARAGMTARYFPRPYNRCVQGVREESFDGFVADSPADKTLPRTREAFVYWLLAALVPRGSDVQAVESLDVFRGMRALKPKGYLYPPKIERFRGWTVVPLVDAELGPRMIARGRADVFIDDLVWMLSHIERQGLTGRVRLLAPVIDAVPHYLVLRPGLEALPARLDPVIRALKSEGVIDAIYTRAIGRSLTELRATYAPQMSDLPPSDAS